MVFGSMVAYLLLGHALCFTKGLLSGDGTYIRSDLATPFGSRAESDCRYMSYPPTAARRVGFSSFPRKTSSPAPHSSFYTHPSRDWGQDTLEVTQAGASHPCL